MAQDLRSATPVEKFSYKKYKKSLTQRRKQLQPQMSGMREGEGTESAAALAELYGLNKKMREELIAREERNGSVTHDDAYALQYRQKKPKKGKKKQEEVEDDEQMEGEGI